MRVTGVVVALLLVLGGLLTGCAAAPGPGAPVDPRAADVAFARAMIPHHEQALELCALVEGRAVSPAVADLAFRIDREQVKEIGQLRGLLRAWGADPARDHTDDRAHGDGTTHGAHPGMLLPGEIERLRPLSGAEFDAAWATAMIAHHRGAVVMARDLLESTGERSTLTEFARTMIAVQEREIRALTRV